MALLRLKAAAEVLGVHPVTLRRWADEGRVPVVRPGRERRFRTEELERFMGLAPRAVPRREALYVRVSGTTGQESSLAAQEAELRATSSGEVVGVFRDRASGLREHRPGLDRVLAMAQAGQISVVRVTHEDRLARFGAAWLRQLLERDGVLLEVAHPKGSGGGLEELLEDFTALVATFAGRMYGIRSKEAKRRLLVQAQQKVSGDDR
jgi:excisionase family DNA binding protein